MVSKSDTRCPVCKSELVFFDRVKRVVRTKGRKTYWVIIDRFRCDQCGKIHRALPDYILPFKQYEKELIQGVREGFITSSTLGYEDFPCEATMQLWRCL